MRTEPGLVASLLPSHLQRLDSEAEILQFGGHVLGIVYRVHPEDASVFKDVYAVEFLGLPQEHTKHDLHHGLLEVSWSRIVGQDS